ncbi:hypothetical protein [Faecalibacterium sp. I4-1-79]|uniref:hypothetical protein n=1 Tax=Faecalibacterium sp. I4-1-79 TaxID=2929494 RepID=UPI0020148C29|nr:hypothetical protein [Faecalibacterium sp. I4-1-79]UQK40209.1 hypothetical protein MTP36_15735 [Faecalibacterium sp. I4-1-79]
MKKIKRFAAVLLAGIMALALLTACGGSGSDNPEFDAEVESAYLDALNKAFGTSFENDDAIRALAVTHITEKSGADSLTGRARCKTDGDETTVVRQVQLCYDTKSSKPDAFVPLFYEAAKTEAIKANNTNVQALLSTVNNGGADENGRTLELTALGVGARTIGGKTYVAIGFELTNTTP